MSREAFEAWAKIDDKFTVYRSTILGRDYVSDLTNAAWRAWQAAQDDAFERAEKVCETAEVPMPEPDGELEPDGEGFVTLSNVLFDYGGHIYTTETLRTYGDAREAAGYARGLVEAKRDAERYRWLREHFRFANDSMRELWFDPALEPNDSSVPVDLDAEIDRAMSGANAEVKGDNT